jgi:hypothetical protein
LQAIIETSLFPFQALMEPIRLWGAALKNTGNDGLGGTLCV